MTAPFVDGVVRLVEKPHLSLIYMRLEMLSHTEDLSKLLCGYIFGQQSSYRLTCGKASRSSWTLKRQRELWTSKLINKSEIRAITADSPAGDMVLREM
jgi:hypothetical protein